MKTFNIADNTEIRCVCNNTRNGFCHRATLYVNGIKVRSFVASYLNRTWERFEFESVLRSALEKSKMVPKDQIKDVLDSWANDPKKNGMGALGSIAMVAALGNIFAETTEEKNAWKKRMLTAGLGSAVSFPDDFDSLPEEEKQRRLDGAIDAIK